MWVSFQSLLSWGLCEQEERSAYSLPILLSPRVAQAQRADCSAGTLAGRVHIVVH